MQKVKSSENLKVFTTNDITCSNLGINRANNRASLETELFYYIKNYEPLTREEELWEFRKPKDKLDRGKIVRANLRLVYKLAKKSSNSKVTTLELIGAGVAGLNHAIDKYDSSYPNRFFTYAYKWVWVYILNALKENSVVKYVLPTYICNAEYIYESASERPDSPICMPDLEEVLVKLLGDQLAHILIRNTINGESAKSIAISLRLTMRQVYFRIHKAKRIIKEEVGQESFKQLIEESKLFSNSKK